MQITVNLNGKRVTGEIAPDTVLLDFVREQGCFSVKRGCETSNCGLCTVHMDGNPVSFCHFVYFPHVFQGNHPTVCQGVFQADQ